MADAPKRKRTHKAIFIEPEGRTAGKLDRTAKLFWHGDEAGYSAYNLVGYAIARLPGSKEKVVEKRYFREYKNPQRDYQVLSTLKKAGAQVVPGFKLALTRDKDLAFQAVFNDPANRLPVDEAWEMFGEMLQASRQFLPGWAIAPQK